MALCRANYELIYVDIEMGGILERTLFREKCDARKNSASLQISEIEERSPKCVLSSGI
jgi:hypothetical protein